MEITCDNCKSKFKLADEKIPKGKAASFTCPKCKHTISLALPDELESADVEAELAAEFGFEEESEDSSEKPFDFIEEEGNIALVCESDAGIQEKFVHALEI